MQIVCIKEYKMRSWWDKNCSQPRRCHFHSSSFLSPFARYIVFRGRLYRIWISFRDFIASIYKVDWWEWGTRWNKAWKKIQERKVGNKAFLTDFSKKTSEFDFLNLGFSKASLQKSEVAQRLFIPSLIFSVTLFSNGIELQSNWACRELFCVFKWHRIQAQKKNNYMQDWWSLTIYKWNK